MNYSQTPFFGIVLLCMRLVCTRLKSTCARLVGRRQIVNNSRKPQQASQKYNGSKVSTQQEEIFDLRYFQICASRGVGGVRGPRAGHPPYYALARRPRSSIAVRPAALSKGEKSKTSKEAGGTSNRPIPSRILLNFKVKQATGYIKCSASRRLLTFANI